MPDSSSSVISSQPSEVDVSKSNKKSADSRIDLGDITPHNLKLLKKVNQVRDGKVIIRKKVTLHDLRTVITVVLLSDNNKYIARRLI